MKRTTLVFVLTFALIAGFIVIAFITRVIFIYNVISINMMPGNLKGDHILFSTIKKPAFLNIICYKVNSGSSDLKQGSTCISRILGLECDTIEINDGYILRNGTIADNQLHLMFEYYANKKAVKNVKNFGHMLLKPFITNDSVIFTLTIEEQKKLSRMVVLHKICKPNGKLVTQILNSKLSDNNQDCKFVVPKGYCFVIGDNRNEDFLSPTCGLVLKEDILATAIFE